MRKQKIRKSHTKRNLIILLALTGILLLTAVFAKQICPYDPYQQDLSQSMKPPSLTHLCGTDRYGRDLFSRIIMGSRTSIFSTLVLVAFTAVFGTLVGTIAGWKGGAFGAVMMRISDIFLAFPGLVFALAIAGVLGGGIQNAVIALAAISWPKYARIARSQTLTMKERPFISAARMSGDSEMVLIFRHILPNILSPILVTAVLDIGTMMMELAGLSYLGLGAAPPIPEWGSMVSEGRSFLQTKPWVPLMPGVAIFITVMVFNLLGDTVRDFMNPKNREAVQK